MIKAAVRALPNYYLQHNGYPAGWHAEINIPSVTIEDNDIKLSQAKLLAATKTGTVNEIWELLGREGISADEIVKMQAEWGMIGENSGTRNFRVPASDEIIEVLSEKTVQKR